MKHQPWEDGYYWIISISNLLTSILSMYAPLTGSGSWIGKVESTTSLPHWTSRYMLETGADQPPGFLHPVPDGISAATPLYSARLVTTAPEMPGWQVFVEVNASGDYTPAFPVKDLQGVPDPEGNGQPSLVYCCEEDPAAADWECRLVGRTQQNSGDPALVDELGTITTAKKLIKSIHIQR